MTENTEAQIYKKRYKIESKLGAGNFGTAYLVTDLKARNELKVLKVIRLGEMDTEQTDDSVNEAKLLSKLDNPYIVKFYESFLENDCLCIVTEYCEGGDLDQRIKELKKQKKQLQEEQVVEWLIQILLAVQYMHKSRVLHRDLKARNIFLKSNQIKIGDFGISRVLVGTMDIATTFTGTPYYMSPEVLKHDGYESKSDIWSVGCLLYEMCAFEHAFDGKGLMNVIYKVVEGKPPEIPKTYSKALNDILKKMLTKDPERRPTATDLLKAPFIVEHRKRARLDVPLEDTVRGKERGQNIYADLQTPVSYGQMKDSNWKITNKGYSSDDENDNEPENHSTNELNEADEEQEEEERTLKPSNTIKASKQSMGDRKAAETDARGQLNNYPVRSNVMESTTNRSTARDNKLGTIIQSKSFANYAEENGRTYNNRARNPSPTSNQALNNNHSDARNVPFNFNADDRPLTPMRGTYKQLAEDFTTKNEQSYSDIQYYDRSPTRGRESNEKFSRNQRVASGSQRSTMNSMSYTIDPRRGPTFDNGIKPKSLVHTIGTTERSKPKANASYDNESMSLRDKPALDAYGPSAKEKKINVMRTKAIQVLGESTFQKVYTYYVEQRTAQKTNPDLNEAKIAQGLAGLTQRPNDCFLVDQLVFLELN